MCDVLRRKAVAGDVMVEPIPGKPDGHPVGAHRCAANSTSVSSTVCRSKVERLITLSTSAVAVCCCSEFAQLVEQPGVLDGDDGLGGEVLSLARSACR